MRGESDRPWPGMWAAVPEIKNIEAVAGAAKENYFLDNTSKSIYV
jgi:hypothetical protein